MLIDTSGWFCLFDTSDSRCPTAQKLYQASERRVTHSFILAELVALSISRKRNISNILLFVEDIIRDSKVDTIWIDEMMTKRAITLLNSREDKLWSLCDAVSFVIMTDLKMNAALSTDHHFEQAGFINLLES